MASETSLYELVFSTDGVEAGAARVRRVVAREGLSVPYSVDVELELPITDGDPRAYLLGMAYVHVLRVSDGTIVRSWTGMVMKIRETLSRGAKQRLVLTLESPLAPLKRTTDYRIFQEKTTKDIVSALLEERGVQASTVDWRLTGSYPTREVCTQFGESLFDFISRLLEEDGIFYFFEHGEDGPKTVFADSDSAYAPTAPSAELELKDETGLVSHEAVTEIVEVGRARPAKVTLRDHDFKRPSLDLEAKAESDAPFGVEHYDYPGRYVEPDEGSRRAQLRMDGLVAEATGARGKSHVFGLAPGHTFTLSGAHDGALDREWVVRSLDTLWEDVSGKGQTYENTFWVLPKELPFRPPQRTARAVVPGPQVAVVTGPSGEEIHTDEFGRVKVRFPWDRQATWDDTSSAWVRVSQMHSSGSAAIPRIGWEVLVDFEDGDPDKPLVLGRLYNGTFVPPYALPDMKTMSSLQSSSSPGGGGHNEVRMQDSGGDEHFHVHAEKDQNVVVANNKTEKVTTNTTAAVGSNHKLTVGANEKLDVGAAYGLTVGGAQTWAVGASRTKMVTGDEIIAITGDRSTTIGASHTTTTPDTVTVTTPATLSETVGGSCLEVAALGVGMMCAGSTSITVGGAKIEAVAAGKNDITVGARAATVGGALIMAAGKDVGTKVGGAKATTVGGVMAANAGKDVQLTAGSTLKITVGGAVAMNAASIAFKVGGSKVTLSAGSVVFKSSTIKLTATGPQPELAPLVADK